MYRQMDTKDGFAIKQALKRGFKIGIISGGTNEGVKKRLELLGVNKVYLGENENKILEFNGSEQISFEEVAKILTKTLSEPIEYVSPEVDEFKQTMASYQLPEDIIEMLTMFSLGIADGEFNQKSDDLESVLGRKTKSITDFLKAVYA